MHTPIPPTGIANFPHLKHGPPSRDNHCIKPKQRFYFFWGGWIYEPPPRAPSIANRMHAMNRASHLCHQKTEGERSSFFFSFFGIATIMEKLEQNTRNMFRYTPQTASFCPFIVLRTSLSIRASFHVCGFDFATCPLSIRTTWDDDY